jgi:hypothetical protein
VDLSKVHLVADNFTVDYGYQSGESSFVGERVGDDGRIIQDTQDSSDFYKVNSLHPQISASF